MSYFDILGIRNRGGGGRGEGVKININIELYLFHEGRTNERENDEWQRQFALYLAYPGIYINGFGSRGGRTNVHTEIQRTLQMESVTSSATQPTD